MITLTINFFWG